MASHKKVDIGCDSCCVHGKACIFAAEESKAIHKKERKRRQQDPSLSALAAPTAVQVKSKPENVLSEDVESGIQTMECTAPQKNHYIGALTQVEAEKRVKGLTGFALYHQLPARSVDEDDIDLNLILPLCIIYRSSLDVAYHFLIARSDDHLSVIIPGHPQQKFMTLQGLVRFYSTFALRSEFDADGVGVQMEVFPLPKTSND